MKPRMSDLLKRIPLKKRAFILTAFEYLSIDEIAYLAKLDLELIKEVFELYDEESKADILKNFSSVAFNNSNKIKKKFPKSRFKNHAGFREDMKETFKSKTEANVARYLTSVFGRSNWEYETRTFNLTMKTKTGRVKAYTPDFKLITKDGEVYLEIKPGFLPQSRDKSKLKNFMKTYPDIKLIIVTYRRSKKVIDWAKENNVEVWIWEDMLAYCESNNIKLE